MKRIVSSITSKGQVTVPVEVRKRLGVGTPAKMAWILEDDDRIAVQPVTLTVGALRGIIPALPNRKTTDFEDQIEEAMEEEAERIVRKMKGR